MEPQTYIVKNFDLDPDGPDSMEMVGAFSKVDGGFIGTEGAAFHLEKMGIAPETMNGDGEGCCCIGFCKIEQTWYGWSHRARYGFLIGSEVKNGDCAYVPKNWEDLERCAIQFRTQPEHLNVTARMAEDVDGKKFVYVRWLNTDDPELIPNERVRGTEGHANYYPPAEWGRGEWKAETLEDAKQMAKDFAEGVG